MSDAFESIEQASAVAEKYARALFDLALEAGALEEVMQELGDLTEMATAAGHPLAPVIENKAIPAADRATVVERVLKGRVSDLTYRFIGVLARRDRLDSLAAVHHVLDRLNKERLGQIDVQLFTARAMDASQLASVGGRISSAIGKTAVLHPSVDASLIGGMKLRMGDRVIDASVAAQLRKLRENMAANRREAARKVAAELEAGGEGEGPEGQ